MADSSENFSADRMDELREQGFVPYSPLATSLAGLAGLLLALLGMENRLRDGFSSLHACLRDVDVEAFFRSTQLREALRDLIFCGVAMLLAVMVVMVFVGLLQTRFLIRPGASAFDLSRLVPDATKSAELPVRAAFLLVVNLIVLALAGLTLYWQIPGLLGFLNLDQSSILASARELVNNDIEICLALTCALAFASWITSRLLFLQKHRKGKNEVERRAQR